MLLWLVAYSPMITGQVPTGLRLDGTSGSTQETESSQTHRNYSVGSPELHRRKDAVLERNFDHRISPVALPDKDRRMH